MLKKVLSIIIATAMLPLCGYSAEASGDRAAASAVGSEEATRQITLSDIKELARKGGELSYDDLAPFTATLGVESARSYMQFERYETDEGYYLLVGRMYPDKIEVAELHHYCSSESIDIRSGNIDDFVKQVTAGKKQLTLSEVIGQLAKKGEELTWADFEPFDTKWAQFGTSSVIPSCTYDLGGGYYLCVCGYASEKLEKAELYRYDPADSIDIRRDDIDAFLEKTVTGTMPVPQTVTTTTTNTTAGNEDFYVGGTKTLTLDDVRALAKKGSSLTWSDFDDYRGRVAGSGLYILEYDLEDDYVVLIGGVPEEEPWYIYLFRYYEQNRIDIREDDVEAFIAKNSAGELPDIG